MGLFGTSEGRGFSRRSPIVSVLDIGSSKICCLVGRLTPALPGEALRGRTHSIEIIGIGHQRSRGIRSGAIADLDTAEHAIRLTVDAAERMAGVTVESLLVNVSAGRLASEPTAASIALVGLPIAETDIGEVLAVGRRHSVAAGRAAVHALPTAFSIDGAGGIADPRGMVGERLGVQMHMVTADRAPLRNLELAVNRCHLSIEAMVASPYAASLAVLADDEAELGCAVIDLGGATTSIAVFDRGKFVHVDAIAVGGQHITSDIARGLSTRVEDAERLKTMHGSALPGLADDREVLSIQAVGGDDEHAGPNQVPRSALTRIIRPRVDEILELVRDRLNASGFASMFGRRLILTGGASQLTGLGEAARRVLVRDMRLGRPLGVSGLPDVAKGPAFAAAVGLMIYPQVAEMELMDDREPQFAMTGTGGYFARVGEWFRKSF
jgi:cell division protein FtsA